MIPQIVLVGIGVVVVQHPDFFGLYEVYDTVGIKEFEPSIKNKLLFLANAVIRDAKARKAYSH